MRELTYNRVITYNRVYKDLVIGGYVDQVVVVLRLVSFIFHINWSFF